ERRHGRQTRFPCHNVSPSRNSPSQPGGPPFSPQSDRQIAAVLTAAKAGKQACGPVRWAGPRQARIRLGVVAFADIACNCASSAGQHDKMLHLALFEGIEKLVVVLEGSATM